MHGWRWAAALPAVLSACSELPMEAVERSHTAPPPAASVTNAACDKYWTIAVGGAWDDSLRWSPSGAPESWDAVCFEAAGSYTVTLTDFSHVEELHIGDGVAVTFTAPDTEDLRTDRLTIARTGRLSIAACAKLDVDVSAVITGNLTLNAPATCTFGQTSWFESLRIDGLLEMHDAAASVSRWDDFVNTGEIRLSGENEIRLGHLQMDGGHVYGSGRLTLAQGDLTWRGGALPPRAGSSAALRVLDGSIRLDNTSLSGAVDIVADSFFGYVGIEGHIGQNVDVGVGGHRKILLDPPVYGNPYKIMGRLTSNGTDTAWVDSDSDIVNTGTIAALSGALLVTAPALDNRGTIEVDASLRFGSSRLENRGAIDVRSGGVLTMMYSDFRAFPAGTMTGRLELGVLSELIGNGAAGDVVASGGSSIVSPGTDTSPIGRLTLESLSLTQNATTVLDIGGTAPGTSDLIRVANALSYGGTLEVRTVAPFVGGLCGQDIPLIHLADSSKVPLRTFHAFAGMQQSPKAEWRARYAPHGARLAGFDPTVMLSFGTQRVALSEGGPGVRIDACLGSVAPQRTVDFTLRAGAAQVTAQPSPLRFDPIDWTAPRSLTLTAVDDTVGEGPHSVTLTFVGASTDSRYDRHLANGPVADIRDDDPGVDLALALVQSPAAATVNQTVEARYRVTNAGPGASTGSTFTFVPLDGLTYVGNSAAATCTAAPSLVTCTVGALASGAQVEFTIVFRTQAAGVFTNTAQISGNEYDHVANSPVAWTLTVN